MSPASLAKIEHVCARENLSLTVKQGGALDAILEPMLEEMKGKPTVIYANSASKAKKIAVYLGEKGKSKHGKVCTCG
jgi:hypothetical protein